jgi:hypothetical protein
MLSISSHLGDISSHHLLATVEDLLKQPKAQIKFQSKSLDDLRISQEIDDNHVSNTTRTEMDLSGIGCCNIEMNNNQDDLKSQRSQSAPVSPTKFYDKELAAFLQCEQQQLLTDNFVYNIDLSDTNETSHQPQLRTAIFFVSLLI